MNKKLRITIGIAAYNEEKNISTLLRSISEQTATHYGISEILIVTDGCSDNTAKVLSQFNHKKIKIIIGKKRKGKFIRLQEIFKKALGDVVVILDADTVFVRKDAIDNLIKPFLKDKMLGATSGLAIPIEGKTIIEKAVNISVMAYHEFFMSLKNLNNVYSWEGRIFAVSKKYFGRIIIPTNIIDDIYFYFHCKRKGLSYKCVKNASVFFKSPTNIKEQIEQNKRFKARAEELSFYFGKMVQEELSLPRTHFYKTMIMASLEAPFYSLLIFGINLISNISLELDKKHILNLPLESRWVQAKSTKGGLSL